MMAVGADGGPEHASPRRRHRTIRQRIAAIRAVPQLGRNIAILGVVVVLGIATTGYILVRQGDIVWPWQHREVMYAEFSETPGVAPGQGQQVRIAGVEVGLVTGATVTKHGLARLTMNLQSGTTLYANAHILEQAGNPLNEIYLDVNPGGPPAKKLAPGSTIPAVDTSYAVQLGSILQHLGPAQLSGVTDLLSAAEAGLSGASTTIPPDLNAATVTLTDLRPVASALAARQGDLRTLVSDLSTIAQAVGGNDQQLANLADSAETTLGTLATNDEALSATLSELPGVTGTLRTSLSQVTALTGEIDPALQDIRSASGALPSTLRQLSTVVGELGTTVKLAGPVVADAEPVVGPLRSFIGYAKPAVADLASIGPDLNPITAGLVQYLPWLQAFVYNTTSVTSTQDANGPILRGLLEVSPNTLPITNPLQALAGAGSSTSSSSVSSSSSSSATAASGTVPTVGSLSLPNVLGSLVARPKEPS